MFRVVFLIPLLLIAALLGSTGKVAAKTLEAVKTNSKLPTGMYLNPVVYDGQDSIYVLGGHLDPQIVKYSLASGQVHVVGKMPDQIHWGSAVWGGHGNVFYFGGRDFYTEEEKSQVWGLNTNHPGSKMTVLSNTPKASSLTSAVWDGGDKVYVFGAIAGSTNLNLAKYSIANRKVVNVALRHRTPKTSSATAVWDTQNKVAFIFGGYKAGGYSSDILKFDPAQNSVTKVNGARLPVPMAASCSVWTGKEAYILGGFGGRTAPWAAMVRFNPSTNKVAQIAVSKFPEKLHSFGCAYVKKSNRIYVLGGRVGDEARNHEEIMYISLGS